MKVRDLFPASYVLAARIEQKVGKRHEVPCNPSLEQNPSGLDYGGESLGIKRSLVLQTMGKGVCSVTG